MGLKAFSSSYSVEPEFSSGKLGFSSGDTEPAKTPFVPDGQPVSYRYKIKGTLIVGKYILVSLKYPDCNTYGGNKLAIYKTSVWKKAKKSGVIDPHFLKGKNSPIARFEPTKFGRELAMGLLSSLL